MEKILIGIACFLAGLATSAIVGAIDELQARSRRGDE